MVGVLASTCVEATARCSAELGCHATMVRDATAALSSEAMHAPPMWLGSYAKWERTRRGRGGDTGPTDGSPPSLSRARDRRAPRPRVVKITAHRFGTAPCRLRDVPVHQDGNHPFGDRLSRLEARFRRRVYRPIRARIATRLAGPRVGAFWRPGDPAWISLPGPAWLGAG
jgi:hypothetical protein